MRRSSMCKLKFLRFYSIMHSEIKLNLANIANLEADAIIDAADEQFLPGTGVCGAIHKAAGRELDSECRSIGYCKTGESVLTNGYQLKVKKVITLLDLFSGRMKSTRHFYYRIVI